MSASPAKEEVSFGHWFRVEGLGFRVRVSGFRVEGLGFRFMSLGSRLVFEFRVEARSKHREYGRIKQTGKVKMKWKRGLYRRTQVITRQ